MVDAAMKRYSAISCPQNNLKKFYKNIFIWIALCSL